MIKKSLIAFGVLFVSYSIYVGINHKLSSSQHQWQTNLIKAQKYIYDESDTIENVIIGSSLSCRLVMDSLPSFYNLSFHGQGVFDGLKIIKSKKNLPENVFIETNELLRKENEEFTFSVISEIPYFLGKNFLALRAEKQPIPLFIEHSEGLNILRWEIRSLTKRIANMEDSSGLSVKKEELFHKILKQKISVFSEEPDRVLLKEQLSLLLEYVHFLKSNGVRVCFFEMPVNSGLAGLPKMRIPREEIPKFFEKEKIEIFLQDSTQYETSDGIHLAGNEAIKYTSFFKLRANNLDAGIN